MATKKREAPTEPFKRAVAGCVRAVAGKRDIDVTFAADRPLLLAQKVRLPEPPRRLTPQDAAFAASIYSAGAIVSTLALGPAIARFGAGRVLATSFVIGAISIALVGGAHLSHGWTLVVLAVAGGSMISRQGAALLHAAGLDDWIARDVEAFVAIARERAANPAALATLRAGLRSRLAATPLTDGAAFARRFGVALDAMWRA